MAKDGNRYSAAAAKNEAAAGAFSAIVQSHSVGHLVTEVARVLANIPDAAREAKDLVAAVLDVPRHWPLLHENKWVEPATWQRALDVAQKRAAGTPLQYAVGRAAFRSLTLDVDDRVLIPRPETELLVDLVLARTKGRGVVVDVGTGSGAIAIALATEGRFERVLATDISSDALDVARANAGRLETRVEFFQGDLLSALDSRLSALGSRLSAVVSNPPYIAFEETEELPASVRDWEPMVALLSPENGLAITARLVRQAVTRLEPGGLLALEVDARRASLVAELVATDGHYTDITVELDLAGRERFVLATRREETS